MAATQITLTKFQDGYEQGLITDVFSVTIGNQKRLYGKTTEGNALPNAKPYKVVYCEVT